MSNAQVGSVYSQIIADVVDGSRVDFEEGGVDEAVLEELKQVWQQKLSQLKIAVLPWDPKPEPQQNLAAPPPVPSNAGNYQAMSSAPQQQPMLSQPMAPQYQQMNHGGPRIKTEPGLDSPTGQPPYQNPLPPQGQPTAAYRAAMNLQNNYGPRAAASINAIQSSVGGQQQGHQQGHPQMTMQQMQQTQHMQQQQIAHMQQNRGPGGQQPQGQQPQHQSGQQGQQRQLTAEQYKAAMAQQAQNQMQQQQRLHNQNNGVNKAQTDGAGDEMEDSTTLIKRVDANGEEIMGRIHIDGLIRDRIAAMGQSMEGGGLMLPLHQASNSKKRQRKVKKSTTVSGQHDGPDSDEDDKSGLKELDEDAINSDLDDSDDQRGDDDDEDDSMGHIMLCMYDKVQRVKNKWKCVMKDGVLTVNDKEYVFHKASGEYEW